MKKVRIRKLARNERALTTSPRSTVKDHNAWRFPEGLFPLRNWLKQRCVDTGSLKSARQALLMTVRLSGLRIEWPKRGEEFPVLLKLQRQLTGAQPTRPRPAAIAKRTSKSGTFGAASEVRKIDAGTLLVLKPDAED